MESHLAEVYQVLHPYLDPKAKSLLRLVSKAVRVAVDEYVDTLHVRQCQLRQLGESAFQPTCLTIHLSYEAPQSWAGLQLAFVLRNLKTLIMMAGKLSSQLCQVSTLIQLLPLVVNTNQLPCPLLWTGIWRHPCHDLHDGQTSDPAPLYSALGCHICWCSCHRLAYRR
jgi:hypothetical protein